MDLDPDVNLLNEILPSNCNYYTIPEFCDLNINQNNFSLLNYNVRSFHNIDNGNSLRAMLHTINMDFSCIVLYICEYNPQSRGGFYEEEINSCIKAEININT